MAALTCAVCGAAVEPSDLICPECSSNLARVAPGPGAAQAAAGLNEPRAREAPPEAPGIPSGDSQSCPHCAAPIPDPGSLVCIQCVNPLAAGAEAPRLRLAFTSWDVEIPPGGSVLLGRDAASPAAAALSVHDNVSRHHATVTLTWAGQASVKDERSTNGTFVNGEPLTPGQHVPLRDGDTLRLASNITAAVRFIGRPSQHR